MPLKLKISREINHQHFLTTSSGSVNFYEIYQMILADKKSNTWSNERPLNPAVSSTVLKEGWSTLHSSGKHHCVGAGSPHQQHSYTQSPNSSRSSKPAPHPFSTPFPHLPFPLFIQLSSISSALLQKALHTLRATQKWGSLIWCIKTNVKYMNCCHCLQILQTSVWSNFNVRDSERLTTGINWSTDNNGLMKQREMLSLHPVLQTVVFSLMKVNVIILYLEM